MLGGCGEGFCQIPRQSHKYELLGLGYEHWKGVGKAVYVAHEEERLLKIDIPIDQNQPRSAADVPSARECIHVLHCLLRLSIRSISGTIHRRESQITLALIILCRLLARDKTCITSWCSTVVGRGKPLLSAKENNLTRGACTGGSVWKIRTHV